MGVIYIRPPIERKSLIPQYGLEIGERGDRWEEEFIKNTDFSTMDNAEDWSYLFSYSKAYDFDLSEINSESVTNMNYMFQNVTGGDLSLDGLVIGAQTTAINLLSGTFNSVDFTGAQFYSLPANMFNGANIVQGLRLATLDVSNLTSLAGMFYNASLPSLDLTGFDISTITDVSNMFNSARIPIVTGLNTLDFSNVVNAAQMFYSSSIPTIDLSGVSFTLLQNAYGMFNNSAGPLSNESVQVTIDLSDCVFPSIVNASYMFYQWMNNDIEPNFVFDNMKMESSGLDTSYMFAYIKMPDSGLDLSCFEDVIISNGDNMFYNTVLGETDFSTLDFSGETSYSHYPFYGCQTPEMHLKTSLSPNITSYSQFGLTYYDKAINHILELTFPTAVNRLGYFISPQASDLGTTSYLIKNSTIYASDFSNFISGSYPVQITFENSVLHMGNSGRLNNFIYCTYYGSDWNDTYLDMRGLVVDGVCTYSYGFMGYGCSLGAIYFPNTGIKFSNKMSYFCYGYSGHSPVLYNLDKIDVSDVQEMEYLFYSTYGSYDLSNWNVGQLQSISYLLQNCTGNFNLSNLDTDNLTRINGIASSLNGNLDIRNWDLSNVTYIYGISGFAGSVDFDGWVIPRSRDDITNCMLISEYSSTSVNKIAYIPNTLYNPIGYDNTMFYGGANEGCIIDIYTNAISVEEQGWKFSHIYTKAEPYGYRLHLNSTHDDFLQAIGGD